MNAAEPRSGYAGAQKWLHWLNAAAVLSALPLGIAIANLKPESVGAETFNRLYDLHRSFGFTVLVIAQFRVVARILYGPPADLDTLTAFERIASKAVHRLLYVLIFVTPLLGWAATSAYRAEVSVFGLFHLPHFVAENRAFSERLLFAHKIAALTMAALVALHVAGALMHLLVKRDGVMRRMLPGG